jgi:hypothetical protein
MKRSGLTIRYQLVGRLEPQIREAALIELNGKGGLALYSPDGGGAEYLDLNSVRNLSIQTIRRPLTFDVADTSRLLKTA